MKKSIFSFVAVILLIAAMCSVAAFGLNIGPISIASVMDEDNGIRRGLDLAGGSTITFEADIDDDFDTSTLDENMDIAITMLRQRLTALGFTEASVSKQGTSSIYVEIPDVKNPEDAVQTLGQTAQLIFIDSDGNEVLNGTDVEKATALYGQTSSFGIDEYYISLELKDESADKFTEATKAAASKTDGTNYIAIVMDNTVISMPYVDNSYATTGISGGSCIISGTFTATEAQELADIINIGQMPFNLIQVELRSVGPLLGEEALSTSLLAAAIGIALVIIFMIVMYKVPGIIAAISLTFYIALVAIVLSAFRVNLSLPGIAGIILSIGMAVDANVVIFERIKEELKTGKSVKASINSGFSRAFTAIFDSNLTTLIAAVVLYTFGTGTIVGFAMTLGIGVVISMFTALTVTHFMLNRLVDIKVRNPKFYGA